MYKYARNVQKMKESENVNFNVGFFVITLSFSHVVNGLAMIWLLP